MRAVVVLIVLAGAIALAAGLAVGGLLWLAPLGLVLVVVGAAMALLGALVFRS
jgi:hypothetical protein